jgi:hypothetical protein
MNDLAGLDHVLGIIAASGRAEVREDGEWLADFNPLHFEIRRQGKNTLVHLWSAERNLTRRVVSVREQSEGRILLEVQRFGRTKPGRLEFLCADAPHSAGRVSRQQFLARVRRILAESFPDATVESLTAAPDLKNSLSGLYVRGRMHEGSSSWALLAVPPSDETSSVEASLAFGILWLDQLRSHAERRAIQGLRMLVPQSVSSHLKERVLALSATVHAEIFEFSERDGQIRKVDPVDAGNIQSRLLPRPEVDSLLESARAAASRIPSLAVKLFAEDTPIAQRIVPGTSEAMFLFRGLEFARWSIGGLSFGLDDSRLPLTKAAVPSLEKLLRQLELHRNSLAARTSHPLYRKAPERWIETIIREDPTKLDAQLDPRFLYSQIPAFTAGNRGVLDLLGVTRRGQLVVIELKASEDIQLPIQAVDYWLRVRRHQREGDFERNGYFSGMELDSKPPFVWLVAPALQFHSTIDTLLKYLSPEIHITRIGINENWRRGLKVTFRQ